MKSPVILIFLICLSLYAQVTQEWVKRYNGTANASDQGIYAALDAAGYLYVSGVSAGTGTAADIVTIKYDPVTGDTIWVNRYAGASNDQVNAMMYYSNAVYVTGWSLMPSRDIITIKYDAATGNRLWVKTHNGAGNGGDYGFAIAVDASGNVYSAGRSDVGGAQKFTVLKYDAAGNMAPGWPFVYSGSLSTLFDEVHAIKVDASGNVYATGRSGPSGAIDFATLKINSSGIIQWAKKYNGTANGEDNSAALVLDNAQQNIFVAGYRYGSGSLFDFVIIKYAASNGDSVAGAIYNGPVNVHDLANVMTIDNSNNIYVAGMSWGTSGTYDLATVKYDSQCIQQWVGRYHGPGTGPEAVNAIALDVYGNVYVTGYSPGSGSGNDYATIMYNSAGVQKWLQRYNGPANGTDAGSSVVVDNSGYVYVTGWSAGIGTGVYDFATIKYRQLPDGPTALSAAANMSKTINLAWTDNSTGEEGFKIERSADGGSNWSLLATLPVNSNSYADSGLTPYSIYHYRVFAFNMFGSSPYSNTAFDTAMSSDPIDNINVLISMVNDLKDAGVLNQGQANSLIVKLNAAIEKIQQGKFETAINQINAFINHVNAFVNGGILTQQQGQLLIDIANDVIELLNQSSSPFSQPDLPSEFALHNNYPNPFNPVTTIRFDIAKPTHVKIIVFNVLGQEKTVLINRKMEAGKYETTFDAANYPSGVYLIRLQTEYFSSTKKMILLK